MEVTIGDVKKKLDDVETHVEVLESMKEELKGELQATLNEGLDMIT